ncbi:Na/Pi cotransporter [Blautia sp. An249]|uniref:Na/Pi cotransporter family protein n=1 Tax=Blautia sp. An249 TaxID=1965603 RepID=UPI000B3ADB17|nr:Na/Pi cotransporter family protein [Blautia sp. An249]OUO80582.1 Na/Pi cotransporter [Blautia sp. An249]
MDLFSVLTLIGGLALFLYGMQVMGDGLAKVSGGKLERILENLTSSPIKAVLLGAGVTAVIQSSSATTVMVVGFVNSGIMKLSQAVGVIMGANIGTTVTSWILSLAGIESSNFFIQLLKPSSFSPILAAIGIVFIMFQKNEKRKDIGLIMVGFAVLMFGMETMSGAVEPLADVPEFTSILTMFSNPLLGLLAGAILTAIIQSSSASVGILQALCLTGTVSYGVALPIIMGQNIGTCITAILSSIGTSKNAKRAAVVHLSFNVIGTTIFMVLFYTINAFVHFSFVGDAASPAGIAVLHSTFNIFATIILLPFGQYLVKLACLIIRDKEGDAKASREEEEFQALDPRFLEKPAFAMEQSRHAAVRMARESQNALSTALELLMARYDSVGAGEVERLEAKVDRYEDELGTYLVKLSHKDLNAKDNHSLSVMLHCIGDFERISDHAVNLMESAQELYDKGLSFSKDARAELKVFCKAVNDIVDSAYKVFETEDQEQAKTIEPMEEVIDGISTEMKNRHIKRLKKGECTIEMGFILSDIITDMERIADHCSNIAVCVVQVLEDAYDNHSYLDYIKNTDNEEFDKVVYELEQKYLLP